MINKYYTYVNRNIHISNYILLNVILIIACTFVFLQFIAVAQNYVDPIRIMKEKVIQDISTQRFTGKAALLIESKGEKFIPYLKSVCFA